MVVEVVSNLPDPAIELARKAKEEAIIRNLVHFYPVMSKEHPASWAVFSDDLEHVEHFNLKPCHAVMYDHDSFVYDQLITAVTSSRPIDIEFLKYLIHGPYHQFNDRISIETIDEDYFIRCRDLSTWPANVLYNFCIATRVPIEFPHFIDDWWKLNRADVDPGLAFLIVCRNTYGNHRVPPDPWSWKLTDLYCPGGHFPFDAVSRWDTWIKGVPLLKSYSANFKDNPSGVTPSNTIWGKETPEAANALVGKTVKELSEHFGLIESAVVEQEPHPGPVYAEYMDQPPIGGAQFEEIIFDDDHDIEAFWDHEVDEIIDDF